jgi:hypothetical protein
MEHPPGPESRDDRIAHAAARVDAAMARVSQAQEALTKAKQRLALVRLALEDATARGANDPPRDDAAERNGCAQDDSGAARGAG